MTFNLPVLILADKALAHVSLWQKRRAPVEILLKPLRVSVNRPQALGILWSGELQPPSPKEQGTKVILSFSVCHGGEFKRKITVLSIIPPHITTYKILKARL